MTFDLIPLRLHFIAPVAVRFPQYSAANLLRGILGNSLMKTAPDDYARRFAPEYAGGPSGLRQAPRPYVFRAAQLAGTTVAAGAPFHFGINLFETRDQAVDLFANAFVDRFGPAQIENTEILKLPIAGAAVGCCAPPASRVRVHFLTPTAIKGTDRAEFGPMLSRIRDRASTIRGLYGEGPFQLDFRALGERASLIRATHCDLNYVEVDRISQNTGYTHPLGGFTGVAEYEGDLAEFLPFLEIARWTGVGRQTVWGNGEIAWETF